LLSSMFGAQLHFTGAGESAWGELEIAREALTDELADEGAAPFAIPIGGSTAVGALGYATAFDELLRQCGEHGVDPAAIVHTSSSGGTHAGLVAGRALARAQSSGGRRVHEPPEVLAIGVAKGVNLGLPDIVELAGETLELIGEPRALVAADDVLIDAGWMGADYAIPTEQGDAAIRWAARHGGWVLDRVYSGKGMAGLLGNAEAGRWPAGSDVVFIHTGGVPAIFTPGGVPASALA